MIVVCVAYLDTSVQVVVDGDRQSELLSPDHRVRPSELHEEVLDGGVCSDVDATKRNNRDIPWQTSRFD